MLNVPVTKVSLQRPRVVTLVCQSIPAGMPEHVRVRLECQFGPGPTPTVFPGGVREPLDLSLCQVLAGAQVGVGGPLGPDCSVYGGWRNQAEVPFGHAFRAPSVTDCSYNARSLDSIFKTRCIAVGTAC